METASMYGLNKKLLDQHFAVVVEMEHFWNKGFPLTNIHKFFS